MTPEHPTDSLYKEHAVFQSPGPNARIWRYCDLAKLVSLVSKRALHFPLAAALDDPFEGALPRILASVLPRDILPVLAKSSLTTFVSCWHLNEYESAGMWQLYSRINEGLAIQSTFSRLTSSFRGFTLLPTDLRPPDAIFAGTVNYIDYDREPLTDPHWALNGLSLVIHKRRSFAHEQEVRAACWIPWNCGTSHAELTPKHKGIYVDCDLHQLVERVYVSPLAPPYFRDAVEAICQRFDLKVPILHSDLMSKPLY